ncbi:MAG: response regulator [Pontimonas sp.]|nr:response regulator [Pontimonas sp.]
MAVGRRSVLVLDDDRLLASLIGTILSERGFTCFVAHTVSQARAIMKNEELDVALLDVHLGDGPSGIQLAKAIESSQPGVGIVFLSKTPDLVNVSADKGSLPASYAVAGKDNLDNTDELVDAIESALSSTRTPIKHSSLKSSPLDRLTTHQLSILREVAGGLTNKAIAQNNEVTERSVERTLQAIFLKLGVAPSDQQNPRVAAIRAYVDVFGFPPQKNV